MSDVLIITTPAELRAQSRVWRRDGMSVALVPTMGALHAGHMSLIEDAASRCDRVIVSIFVNPLQFDRDGDFTAYPRPIDDDVAACKAAGVHAVYAPTAATMYPDGHDTVVSPGAIATRWEGEHRPGHFTGMATVVTKLLNTAEADIAVFGEKDAQQVAIVAQFVADLDIGTEIVVGATVREPDGLAMSSRNRHLTDDQRRAATSIDEALRYIANEVAHGADIDDAVAAGSEIIAAAADTRIDYLAVVDPRTFEPTNTTPARVIAAVWVGDTRLIDNREIGTE